MLTQWVLKNGQAWANHHRVPLNQVNVMVPWKNQTSTCGKLITMDPFHNRGVDDLSLQETALILDLDASPSPVRPLLGSCQGLIHYYGTSQNTASARGLPSERSAHECHQLSRLCHPEAWDHIKLNNGVIKPNLWRQLGDMSWSWVEWVLDTEMLSRCQNIWVQKQSVNTGFVSYGYLIIQLQNVLFPSTNSSLSKLNLFSQGRSPSTRIHSLSPIELGPAR